MQLRNSQVHKIVVFLYLCFPEPHKQLFIPIILVDTGCKDVIRLYGVLLFNEKILFPNMALIFPYGSFQCLKFSLTKKYNINYEYSNCKTYFPFFSYSVNFLIVNTLKCSGFLASSAM